MMKKIFKKLIPQKYHEIIVGIRNDFLDGYSLKSYSQEGEDMVLRRCFEVKQRGFYVDVGAHHPKKFSNTYFFYKRGWRGINIDAMPGSMKLFHKFRNKDVNIEVAISNTDKPLKFYMFNEPALNSFSKELSVLRNKGDYKIIREMEIASKRLENVLDDYIDEKQKIDFLSVDVEGLDLDVIQSNNWEKYRPEIVLVEILVLDLNRISENEIAIYMRSHDYEIFGKTFNTVFFRDQRLNI